MTEISVLLPVYNTNPNYLKECITSILNQTFRDFELIILNDNSTNNLEVIINSFNDNRIKYYKNDKNEGITSVRNKLIKLAKGKYIAVADHDDISLPERLEKEYNFLENNPDISIVSSWIRVLNYEKPETKIWKRKPYPKLFDFLKRCELIHPACMWRKADFEKFNLKYEENLYSTQDYALFSKAVRYLNFANIQEVLLYYRKHNSNASLQKQKMALETESIQKELIEFLTSDKKEQKYLFENFTYTDVNFAQKIFSITNINNQKIIRFLGLKIKLRHFKKGNKTL